MRALVLVCVLAADARANPEVVVDRCADRVALAAAIDGELAAITRDPIRDDLVLVIECVDATTARLSIAGFEHVLDLGDVEPRLRPKLIVLAAVEILKLASAPRRAATASPTEPPTAATPMPPPTPMVVARAVPARVAAFGAPAVAPAPRYVLASRLGVRIFPQQPVPLGLLGFGVEWRRFAVGATGSLGSTDDTLGALAPYLATVAASVRLVCEGAIDRLCVRSTVEAGLAGVRARAANAAITARDARAPYAQLGIAVDVEHVFGAIAATVAVEAAWAEGLVATAQDREPVRLDGAAVTAVIGVRWRR